MNIYFSLIKNINDFENEKKIMNYLEKMLFIYNIKANNFYLKKNFLLNHNKNKILKKNNKIIR